MAPKVTLNPTSGPPGTKVTVTVVRDIAKRGKKVENLTVTVPGRIITQISDNGTTYIGTFIV